MRVARWANSTMMPMPVVSRCWTMKKAMPQASGTCFRNSSRASSPPAEIQMPTIENSFCVIGSCASAMIASDPFFRFGILNYGRRRRHAGHSLEDCYLFDIDQTENQSVPTEFIKVAHPTF